MMEALIPLNFQVGRPCMPAPLGPKGKRIGELELTGGLGEVIRAGTKVPTVAGAEMRRGPRGWTQAPVASPSVSPGSVLQC